MLLNICWIVFAICQLSPWLWIWNPYFSYCCLLYFISFARLMCCLYNFFQDNPKVGFRESFSISYGAIIVCSLIFHVFFAITHLNDLTSSEILMYHCLYRFMGGKRLLVCGGNFSGAWGSGGDNDGNSIGGSCRKVTIIFCGDDYIPVVGGTGNAV